MVHSPKDDFEAVVGVVILILKFKKGVCVLLVRYMWFCMKGKS